jgi:hypothetical protein
MAEKDHYVKQRSTLKIRKRKAHVQIAALACWLKKNGLYRVTFRRSEKFKLKPSAAQLDGKEFYFRKAWPIGSDDSSIYAGEWAMMPCVTDGNYPREAPAWIATGDLRLIRSGLRHRLPLRPAGS